MSSYKKVITRWLAGALVLAAAATPAAAQASAVEVTPSGSSVPANLSGGLVAPVAGSGFQWGDAGIGAAAALAVLGAGTGASAASRRRRRTRRTVAG